LVVVVVVLLLLQITGVLHNMRPAGSKAKLFREPSHCPSCSSPLRFVDAIGAGAKGTLRCENSVCPAQQMQQQVGGGGVLEVRVGEQRWCWDIW
jgi:hypothetical protein